MTTRRESSLTSISAFLQQLGRRRFERSEPGPLRASILAAHPGFRPAVLADAKIASARRSERSQFRGRIDAAIQVLRLMLVTDSFFAQVCYRAKVRCRVKGIPILPHLLHRLAVVTGQISIGDPVVIHPGVYIPHGQVVVDAVTVVHSGTTLSPFTTLGLVVGHIGGPTVGPSAQIGTGAKILGPVRVGAFAKVGANAVVLCDVPPGVTAVGVPARIIDLHLGEPDPTGPAGNPG